MEAGGGSYLEAPEGLVMGEGVALSAGGPQLANLLDREEHTRKLQEISDFCI